MQIQYRLNIIGYSIVANSRYSRKSVVSIPFLESLTP